MQTVEKIKEALKTEVQQIKLYADYLKRLDVEKLISYTSARDALAGIMDGRAIVKVYKMQLFDCGIMVHISDDCEVSFI